MGISPQNHLTKLHFAIGAQYLTSTKDTVIYALGLMVQILIPTLSYSFHLFSLPIVVGPINSE